MVIPFVKAWRVQDHGNLEDLDNVPNGFYYALELEIAYEKLRGVDDFIIDICDKEGLKKDIDRLFESDFERSNNTISCYLHKAIVLKEFNKEEIKELITEFVSECASDSWKEVYLKLKEKLEYYP